MQNRWSTNIKYMRGIGPAKAALLAKLGIYTIGHLLEHYPRRYEDRSQLKPIKLLTDNQQETFQAIVVDISENKPRRGLVITKLKVQDATGWAQLVWFNQSYIKNSFKPGMQLVISGKVKRGVYQPELQNPEVEIVDGDDLLHTGRVIPIYPANETINQRFLRLIVYQALEDSSSIVEVLPPEIINHYNLMARAAAINNIHFPENQDMLVQARHRLVFEELYLLQCGLLYLKSKNQQNRTGIKHAPDGQLLKNGEARLPFTLTSDQQQVLREIKADMEDITPMQRLVQGDVGSGKTAVAAIALLKTVENGYQGAMMVPTEILAEQHYHTLAQMLAPLGVHLVVLSGKLTKRGREGVLSRIRDGLADIVVGTHALIQENVEFKQLGLVVTDEQHRFGVNQRAKLLEKGAMPDMLVMTATPIPRTMALTVYGDLDVSVIRQLPPGRKPIKTFARGIDKKSAVYDFVVKEVASGRQAYVVCPLVEESDKIVAQSAVQVYEQLTETYFKHIPCGLVHGKLRSQSKDAVMNNFYRGEIKVLVATTVIEVGVNVPNATVMVIEGADRFGLAQLHQLRGRIGRGEHQSYCILLSDSKSSETRQRLEIMTQTNDGFVLAEKDLELRGPGQFFGARQHGMPDLKIANIVRDVDILLEARSAAQQTVSELQRFSQIRPALAERFGQDFELIFRN